MSWFFEASLSRKIGWQTHPVSTCVWKLGTLQKPMDQSRIFILLIVLSIFLIFYWFSIIFPIEVAIKQLGDPRTGMVNLLRLHTPKLCISHPCLGKKPMSRCRVEARNQQNQWFLRFNQTVWKLLAKINWQNSNSLVTCVPIFNLPSGKLPICYGKPPSLSSVNPLFLLGHFQ